MLDNFGDKGNEDWEIYAHCLREAMSKASHLGISDQPLKSKLAYEKLMKGSAKELVIGDNTYSFEKTQD